MGTDLQKQFEIDVVTARRPRRKKVVEERVRQERQRVSSKPKVLLDPNFQPSDTLRRLSPIERERGGPLPKGERGFFAPTKRQAEHLTLAAADAQKKSKQVRRPSAHPSVRPSPHTCAAVGVYRPRAGRRL
jgi:hypothetical protein